MTAIDLMLAELAALAPLAICGHDEPCDVCSGATRELDRLAKSAPYGDPAGRGVQQRHVRAAVSLIRYARHRTGVTPLDDLFKAVERWADDPSPAAARDIAAPSTRDTDAVTGASAAHEAVAYATIYAAHAARAATAAQEHRAACNAATAVGWAATAVAEVDSETDDYSAVWLAAVRRAVDDGGHVTDDDLLRDLAAGMSSPTVDDAHAGYVEVQVDRATWLECASRGLVPR